MLKYRLIVGGTTKVASEEKWIVIPNWDDFQHYKDRDPKWIKNYNSLLHKDEYLDLSGHQRALLHGLWIAYASSNCRLRLNTASLSRRLHLKVMSRDLDALLGSEWIEIRGEPETRTNDWASRYVSDETRAVVLKRDGYKCRLCGSKDHLEIDHIQAISQGGTGDEENLQTLCRRCNRGKHNKPSVSDLSIKRLPREETETKREEEKKEHLSKAVPVANYDDLEPIGELIDLSLRNVS